jgi:acyl dehydratase
MTAHRFPVEAGHIMMFARAVGDHNKVYSDPEYAASTEIGEIIAPPTFAIAQGQFDPTYPLRPQPDRQWHGSGRGPGSVTEGAGRLHAEQHFTYHRQIRVGDVLSGTTRPGESWEKPGKSGRLFFTQEITEFRDQNGDLVITMRSVGVQRQATS